MPLMLSQSPSTHSPTAQSSRRLSVGAKTRICVHCGRSFRRTEHLERHIRTHTKEKPYTCFCGAAFSRRDLLKRHMGITGHEDSNPPNTKSISLKSQSQTDHNGTKQRTRRASTHIRTYRTPTVPEPPLQDISPSSPEEVEVPQWTMQQSNYMGQNHSIIDTTTGESVAHDAEMLEAAQLLLPGAHPSYPAAAQPSPPILSDSYLPEDYNHFEEFTTFLDSIGLPLEWVPGSEVHNTVPAEVPEPSLHPIFRERDRSRADSPFRSWLPSVPPGDQSYGMVSDYEPPPNAKKALPPFKITEEQTVRLATSLEEFRHLIPDFVLPSRHSMTRYLTSFFDGFYPHLPFIHIPTLHINERAPELVLAFLTVGAQYRFEHRNALRLFRAAKEIVLYKLSKEPCSSAYNTSTRIPLDIVRDASNHNNHASDLIPSITAWKKLETLRTLLVLMGYATWENAELVQEALTLQRLLIRSLRDFGLTETFSVTFSHTHHHHRPHLQLQEKWHTWAEEESIRRTLFISFCYIHIHTIAYKIYPVLRSDEVHLRLPCSTKEWHANTAEEWAIAQREIEAPQLFFQDALRLLLSSPSSLSTTSTALNPIPAPVGNYILLHGILQRINLVSEIKSEAETQAELNKLEKALRTWTTVWQQAPESTLDTNNENGPIPFTSSSLLGLAYVRLALTSSTNLALESRNPRIIADAMHCTPTPSRDRNNHHQFLVPALIYSAHALSIPVRLGIDHIARSQAFFWSVQHSVASLDCAVLLSKWLVSLSLSFEVDLGKENGKKGLTETETRILHWTQCIVQEAYASLDIGDEDEDSSISQPAKKKKNENVKDTRALGRAVIKLWARLFRKNTQWGFINVLGESLEAYLGMI